MQNRNLRPWLIITLTMAGGVIASLPAWAIAGSSIKPVFARPGEPMGVEPSLAFARFIFLAVPLSFMVAIHYTRWGAQSFGRRLAFILVGALLLSIVCLSISAVLFTLWLNLLG